MKMFLVDHEYGACLVIARDRDEAVAMAEATGDVCSIDEVSVPMVFSIHREAYKAKTGTEITRLELDLEEDGEVSTSLEALLGEYAVTLDDEDLAALSPEDRACVSSSAGVGRDKRAEEELPQSLQSIMREARGETEIADTLSGKDADAKSRN